MVGNITFYDFCCFRCVAVNMCINLVFNINLKYDSVCVTVYKSMYYYY